MRVDRLKAKAVAELEAELGAVRTTRDALAAKSVESLWLTDLDVFESAYDTFRAVKEEARAAAIAEAAEAATATKKKRVVKKVAAA